MEDHALNATQLGYIKLLNDTSGTASGFVALVIVSATFPSLIRNLLAVFYINNIFDNKHFWSTLLVDFTVIVLPVELMITLGNEESPYFFAITCIAIPLLLIHKLSKRPYRDAIKTSSFFSLPMSSRLPFISYFRAYTNIFTGFSILAVDFSLYPPYFYKSRVYGTALMDSGLGFYMISNAIVAPEARGVMSTRGTTSSIKKALKDCIPLVFLGFSRFYITGMADYHVPVQEYGVHWNFFFTLAVVKMSSTILFCVTPIRLWFYLGPGIILTYQLLLSKTGLVDFVLFGFNNVASRDGLVEANREGIVASIGFLAIYFIGVQLGRLLMQKRKTVGEWSVATVYITCVCVGSWVMMYVTRITIQRPSRKFANLSYTFFVIGITTTLMVQGMVFDIVITYCKHLTEITPKLHEYKPLHQQNYSIDDKGHTCSLLQAINYNGLLFFALANLMTGVVNLSIDTKSYSDSAAFGILNIYMLILSTIFLYLYRKKFVFKSFLWMTQKKGGTNVSSRNAFQPLYHE